MGDIGTRIQATARPLGRLAGGIAGRAGIVLRPLGRFGGALTRRLPKGLFARSILIVVTPIVLLQSVIAYVFMERHWQMVTRRLSGAVTRDIAAIIEIIETYPQDPRFATISRISAETFNLTISVLPPDPLPPAAPKPFFSLLDRTLSEEITNRIGRPFWIDTVGNSDMVEIRIKLDDHVLRVFAPRHQAYASNSHIFLVWMVVTSLILIAIALLFLRNQIKPILRLAHAAEAFGRGRPVGEFQPRGAREVRQASEAFIDMRERIERHVEQRTIMLSGVSHDLRTILTRFKLELAMLGDGPEIDALRGDVDEMSRMLEDYLAFAKGDAAEPAVAIDIAAELEDIAEAARRSGHAVEITFSGEPTIVARAVAFRRCLANLVGNAGKHASRIRVDAHHEAGWLTIIVDDDGPGIPQQHRESVFRPFYRLDEGRNVDAGGSGLGLTIARDVARSHGGDITLSDSPLGGLRATLRIPA
ncbi:HAMP domain-containing protein [Rhizobiales bacterium L72]|uniref:histidine kinase n=2 Tax=Propylenella binzhouense TaxID=2555902 RepID=A0A964T5M6_9HYPH|nr:ATP-binding protein [Propylenella binzhouense]MYZ48849.1 HAMP domain-containing protein [Propylenella binzhouense]